jgi:hypothetical protein
MARITPIHWRKLLKVFELDGCKLVGTTGDHLEVKKRWCITPNCNTKI